MTYCVLNQCSNYTDDEILIISHRTGVNSNLKHNKNHCFTAFFMELLLKSPCAFINQGHLIEVKPKVTNFTVDFVTRLYRNQLNLLERFLSNS